MVERLGFYDVMCMPERLVPFNRLVVKIGSSSLIDEANRAVKIHIFDNVARQITMLHNSGVEVMLVTSGAVQMGKMELGSFGNGSDIKQKQVEAAVGQPLLMEYWRGSFRKAADLFATAPLIPAQFLPTEETMHQSKPVVEESFRRRILPVVNANDPFNEYEMRQYVLKSADNDMLGGHNAEDIEAEAFVILTDSPGITDWYGNTVQTQSRSWYPRITFNGGSNGGTGGGASKDAIAVECKNKGIYSVIAEAGHEWSIIAPLQGQEGPWTQYIPDNFDMSRMKEYFDLSA